MPQRDSLCQDGKPGPCLSPYNARHEFELKRRRLPICHPGVVASTCRMFSGGNESNTTNIDLLMDQLSVDRTELEKLFKAMKFGTPPWMEVDCAALCSSVKNYVVNNGGTLPQYSDEACYQVNNEKIKCGVDVSRPG